MGDLENRKAINQIILLGKVCIFKEKEQAITEVYFFPKFAKKDLQSGEIQSKSKKKQSGEL